MKRLQSLLIILFCLGYGVTFSQTVDSLNVYPNPFDSEANIYFAIEQSDTITLQVMNVNGEIIKTFFESVVLPSGSYNINLNGDSLINGIYFFKLEIGSTKTITKKAIKNGSITSISDEKLSDKIIVFPNPTNDKITIPIDAKKKIIVTDLNGKIVKSITTDKQTISLLDLATGQYFITVLTENNEKLTTKIILKRN